jgi:hypothetical protein
VGRGETFFPFHQKFFNVKKIKLKKPYIDKTDETMNRYIREKLYIDKKPITKMKYNNNTPFEEFMYRLAIVFGITVITLNLIILVSKLIG